MTRGGAESSVTGLVDRFWALLPYALLVITLALALAEQPTVAQLLWMAVLALFFAVWHWWWAIRHRRWLGTALLPGSVYFLSLLTATAALCLLTFSFFPLYLVCFAVSFDALPGGWAYAGIALTAVAAFALPWLLSPTFSNVAAVVGGGALAAAAGWSIRALERNQARLRQALTANNELQEQLVADARDAGVMAERARLAAEFHDTISAGLTGVISQLEALDAELPPGAPRSRVKTAAAAARDGLDEARRSVKALRPTALSGRSLRGALTVIAAGFERSRGVPVVVRVTGTETEVPDSVEHGLLRAAQEALTNIAQHAGATRVHVTLSYLDDTLALDVTDDGAGFGRGQQRVGGQGLRIMRDRIEALGGQVVIETPDAVGTTVTVSMPITANARTDDGRTDD